MDIMRKENVGAKAEDDNVILTLGHAQAKLHYRTALRVGQHLRIHAKISQHRIADKQHWSKHGLGNIIDLKARVQGMTLLDALKYVIAPRALQPTTQQKKIWVENIGDEIVRLHLGSNAYVDMHYTNGFQLSDWLRTAGKEAKLNASDGFKELSALGSLHDAAAK